MLQSKAGYIDARPLTASSTKISCNARPDHTCGSKTKVSGLARHVRFTLRCRHRHPAPACPFGANNGHAHSEMKHLRLERMTVWAHFSWMPVSHRTHHMPS